MSRTNLNFYDEKSLKKNLQKTWKAQKESDFEEGYLWYRRANLYAASLSEKYNVPLIKVAGTIAALSPMVSWEDNKVRVETYYETGHIAHFFNQQEKVNQINRLLCPQKEEVNQILRGLKTVNFFQSIFEPFSPQPYTIDRWILRASLGREISHITPKQYDFIKNVSLREAKRQKLLGLEYQAVLWCITRTKK